jgi:tight adherence protein C
MTGVVVLAALAALGVVRLYRLAVPAAPQLITQTERWEHARARAGRRAAQETAVGGGVLERAAGSLAEQLRDRRGNQMQTFERDLAITGSTLEAWLTKALGVVLAGFLAPFALLTVVRGFGLGIPLTFAPLAGLALGALMVVLSVADLRTAAQRQREDFRRALSIYLDLVVMSMEAGRGHAEAIPAAVGIGTGRAFTELQDAVDGARVAGITPWEALGRLGERYGIGELVELRSTLSLANDEGGRIRSTLIARSETMREARLADAQARANKATESMKYNLILMASVGVIYILVPRLLYLVTSA